MVAFRFARYWLITASALVAFAGVLLVIERQAASSRSLVSDPFAAALYYVPTFSRPDTALLAWTYGLLGAGIAGWGFLMLLVASVPFARRERWAWFAIFSSVLAWLAGAAVSTRELVFNSELLLSVNVLAAAAFLIPLVLAWPAFRRTPVSPLKRA